MDRQIEESDFVLVAATEEYSKKPKSDNVDYGRGVTWETSLIYQHLYNGKSLNNKFIPIVFSEEDKKFIPTPLQSQTIYNVSNDSEKTKLKDRLRGLKTTIKPPIGNPDSLPPRERKSTFLTTFIDVDLWNQAVWKGTSVLSQPELGDILGLAILFNNPVAARKIFYQWLSRVGEEDKFDQIRVSIIEGEIEGELPGYTVHIGSNIENIAKYFKSEKLEFDYDRFAIISRYNRMNPKKDSPYLNYFKENVTKSKKFYLLPAYLENGEIKIEYNLKILKNQIFFRNVSEIGKNDLDHIVIQKPIK
ncbi:hypothetical protein LEP1GSC017_3999 [Leptospira meyeri serovar Hardjo str. Went 5]|nr:hypothetical protein LEP1GSC017_3999 [Leptospira meyeri serovar Hardjo str. Went 5]